MAQIHGSANARSHIEEGSNGWVQPQNGPANLCCIFDNDEEALQGEVEVWNLTFAFASSMAVKAACLLQIPDILAREGKGASLSVEEIATRLPSKEPNHEYLFRLLRFLTAKGVFFAKSVANSSGESEMKYGLTAISKWLASENNPLSMAPMAVMQTDHVAQAPWHHISDCVLQGGCAFEKSHGIDIWGFASQDSRFNNLFNSAMVCNSEIVMRGFLKSYDGLNGLKTLVDVGGGKGKALFRIVEQYPSIKGINYDLPHVVATAPVYPSIVHLSGDMFEYIPPGDAIFMKCIMHDWDDTDCIKILNNCKKALPGNGKIIIVDVVLDEEKNPFSQSRMVFDLVMIAHARGKERTEEQWKAVLVAGGFPRYNIIHLPHLQSIIEAFPS